LTCRQKTEFQRRPNRQHFADRKSLQEFHGFYAGMRSTRDDLQKFARRVRSDGRALDDAPVGRDAASKSITTVTAEQFVAGRRGDDTQARQSTLNEAYVDREVRPSLDELLCSIERIDEKKGLPGVLWVIA